MNEGEEISIDEWLTYIASDVELALKPGRQGEVTWLGESKHEDPWLEWSRGNIYTKWPDTALYQKMLEIAKALNAKVLDDDDRVYLEPADWVFDPYEQRNQKPQMPKKSWLKRLLGK